jgi:hypothetical protein
MADENRLNLVMVLKFRVGRMGVIPDGMQMDAWEVKGFSGGSRHMGVFVRTQTFWLHPCGVLV